MIKPTPAIAAASATPAWTTGPKEIPAVTCPALGAEEDADGNALIVGSVPEESKGVSLPSRSRGSGIGDTSSGGTRH